MAPSPNWVPHCIFDGDTKPGSCALGINIETSNSAPKGGETGGDGYTLGMGAVGTTAIAACLASGGAGLVGGVVKF